MPSSSCHLPNGQTFSVTRVFGGVTFKSDDMNFHNSAFPPGWTIVIYTQRRSKNQEGKGEGEENNHERNDNEVYDDEKGEATECARFTQPTLRDDFLYLSQIVDPPSSDFKPVISPSRQVAMMLWATLWWYFHEPEPNLHSYTATSAHTPPAGRPKIDWRVNIQREGILKGRNLMMKLERMGLVASEDSTVGLDPVADMEDWSKMFVSRRSFWQLDPRIFLFTLSPKPGGGGAGAAGGSSGGGGGQQHQHPQHQHQQEQLLSSSMSAGEIALYRATGGPFTSGSHLPTYFPPPPPQYVHSIHGVRHPVRPKPPRQGQVFYIRYIPSVDEYLSFRVPFIPPPPSSPPKKGPQADMIVNIEQRLFSDEPSDAEMLHRWMNDTRVAAAWGLSGPREHQEEYLRQSLSSRHSFPIIGCWNGRPFGYFEIYWVKEDGLGRALGGNGVDDYDRGIHVLVGEQAFRGPHRVAIWLSALVHYCWLADIRTKTVYLEPRIDNERYLYAAIKPFPCLSECTNVFITLRMIDYLVKTGFYKEGEVTLPHKQAALMKIKREFWEAPFL